MDNLNFKTRIARLLLPMVVICLLSACDNEPTEVVNAQKIHTAAAKKNVTGKYPLLDKASWILGSWKGVLGEGVSVENWYRQDDSTYNGAGLFIKGNVTLSQETILLTQKGNDLFYIPTVKKQNDGKPVDFRMTTLTDREMVFENPAHDFPQRISYTLITPDSLIATISGHSKGAQHSESFPMVKVK